MRERGVRATLDGAGEEEGYVKVDIFVRRDVDQLTIIRPWRNRRRGLFPVKTVGVQSVCKMQRIQQLIVKGREGAPT